MFIIKYLLAIIIILALIGGAVQFKSTDATWSLIMEKKVAKKSIQTGVDKIYNFINGLIIDSKETTETQSIDSNLNTPAKI